MSEPGKLMRAYSRVRDALCSSWFTRFWLLAAFAALAAWLGIRVGEWIAREYEHDAGLKAFESVTTVAVVLAIWRILAEHWRSLWRFIAVNDRKDIHSPLAQLALAVTGLGLVSGGSESPAAPAASLLVASSIVSVDGATQTEEARILLPFFGYDSKAPSFTGDESESDCERELDRLATIDAEGQVAIRTLACGLRACSDPDTPVIVDVQGFASSRLFKCGKASSEERNHALAERRRTNVIGILNSKLERSELCTERGVNGVLQFQPAAQPGRWLNYEHMAGNRDLLDVPAVGAKADRAREILSRRVDLVLESRGACKDIHPRLVSAPNQPGESNSNGEQP
jgi:hypothetical protein